MISRFFASHSEFVKLATIMLVWRRIHILGPLQSFVLGSVCAALIALPLAIRSASHNDTALLRDLFWPRQLEPYIVFSAFLMGVLVVLLGYFHLGRLGIVLGLGAVFALIWVMVVCAMLCFAALSRIIWLATICYILCVLLVYVLMFWLHRKAIASASFRDAQRKMRLVGANTP